MASGTVGNGGARQMREPKSRMMAVQGGRALPSRRMQNEREGEKARSTAIAEVGVVSGGTAIASGVVLND